MRSISRIPGALVVWVVSYVFFLSTLVNNLSASHDSIHYLLDILQGRELFHQHHLLYNFLASKWRTLLPWVAPHYAIESFTAFWGSSVLTVIYLFFRKRFYLLPLTAALGTAIIACSYGVWFYSVNIEVYMPPLFFIIAALYFVTKKVVLMRDVSIIALLHSLAILFHQVNVLFSIVVIYTIIVNRKSLNITAAVLQYMLIGFVLAGGTYFVAGWFFEGHNSAAGWMRWMEGYTVGHGYWQPLSASTPLHVATGLSHAFIGGHFVFQLPMIERLLQQSFRDHGLTDEIFLSSKISEATAWVLTICTAIVAVMTVFIVFRFIKNYRSLVFLCGHVIRPMVLTIVVYSVFFCFWMPEILEFWIPQMVLIWMLLVGTLPVTRFPFNVSLCNGLVALAVLIFSINFFGSMRWLQDINNDWYYKETATIQKEVSANDLVIVDNEWILKDFIRYYTRAAVLATDEPGYDKNTENKMVRSVLARKGKVFLYRDHRFSRSY